MDTATLLTGAFEPTSLRAGRTYTAYSDDVAYPILRYLVTAGYAKAVWEQFLPEGRVSLTAVVGAENPESEEVEASGRMLLTQKWARDNVIRDYVEWREAWWREAVQNSVDAGSTRIKLESRQQEDETWLIVAEDDGSGMSQQQMEDPNDGFLVFGGSSKLGGIGTGAFGKAKELLVLPWIRWRVDTRDKSYSGVMDAWERRSIPYRKGLRIEVVMPADYYTDKSVALAFLEKCWLPHVAFTINGSHVTTKMPTPTDPDALFAAHDMANIYRYKRERKPQIYVRKNGIWMFSIDLPPQAGESLLVEVTADSKTAFTQSRDNFNYHSLRSYLDRLKAELTTESKLLPRRDRLEETVFYDQRDLYVLAERSAKIQLALGSLPPIGKGPAKFDKAALETVGGLLSEFSSNDLVEGWTLGTTDPIAGLKMCDLVRIKGQKSMDALLKQLVWFQDFRVIKYPKQPLVRKMFLPGSMNAATYRLARVWSEMCRAILMMLGSELEYGIGWVFWDEARALCATGRGHGYVLLNPYVNPGARTDILDPGNPDHLRRIYASAVHECTHFWDGVMKHDEAFSSALTHNIETTMMSEREVLRLTAGIKRRAPKTAGPKTRGSGGGSAKRREKLREIAGLIDSLFSGFRYSMGEAEAPALRKLIKMLGAKPTPSVQEKVDNALQNGDFKKGDAKETLFIWERSRSLGNGWDDVSVLQLSNVALYWQVDRSVGAKMKVWIQADGSRAVNLWNQMIEHVRSLPNYDAGRLTEKPFEMSQGYLVLNEAKLTFADWDADKAADKGNEEYEAASNARRHIYYACSVIQIDWDTKAKDALVSKYARLSSPGDANGLSLTERYILSFIRSLWPFDMEESTGKSLTFSDDVVRQMVNRLAITNQLVTPWFKMDLRYNERRFYTSCSIVCTNSTIARRWELLRTRHQDSSFRLDPAQLDVDLQPDMSELPDAREHWKVLSALIKLAFSFSKEPFYKRPILAEQLDALEIVFHFLGAQSVSGDVLNLVMPILAEHGMVGTPTGDDLTITEGEGTPSFTISLAPGSQLSTERWADLRRFYAAFQPKTESGLQYVADIAFDEGTYQQVASPS